MKFEIAKIEFLKALQRVQGIVDKRNTMPILANVLIEATDKAIRVMATDLEVFIKDSVSAQVSEKGSTTINARKLFEIVKELPADQVSVSTKDDKMTLKAGKSRFNVMGLPAKDFPVFQQIDDAILKRIDRMTFKDMIDRTSFAVSTDETRYNINGFKLESDSTKIRMVATDGHRLALVEKGIVAEEEPYDVLLPRKGVIELNRLLDEDGADFYLGVTQKSAVLKKDETLISIRLLEGEFPDYKKVIPKDNDKKVNADRTTLLSSLKRVSILSTEKIKGVKFSFTNSRLVLNSSSPDIGEATEEIDIEYNGEDVEIAFNARYFIDVLEALDAETITIFLKDQLSPGLISCTGASASYTYIIMPMRL